MYRRKAPRGSHLGAALLGLGTAVALMKQRGARMRPLPTTVALPALLATLLALSLALAPRAEAFVYWTSVAPPCGFGGCSGPPVIGRANLDGTGISQRFVKLDAPAGDVAVDGVHLYWNEGLYGDGIGRANLDGTGVEPNFIATGGGVRSIAVDAHHIYWTHVYGIARANLDGTGVNPDFITTAGSPSGLAVDAEHIYWGLPVFPGSPPSPTGLIGRANIDGTGVEQSFIETEPGSPGAYGGAIAVGGGHIYWNEQGGRTIARANIDGSGINRSFIAVGQATGVQAVDAAHIFWTGCEAYRCTPPIGRANIDGTGAREFISATAISGDGAGRLTVDALTDTELVGDVTAAKGQKQHGNAIVVNVKVSADERLTAKASGKIKVNPSYKLKSKRVELTGDGTSTLKLKPKKAQARQIAAALKRGESATAKLKVKLSDFAAHSEVEKLRVRLKQ